MTNMSVSAVIMMIVTISIVWGGLFYFIKKAYNREKSGS